jgi:hypothetical protein
MMIDIETTGRLPGCKIMSLGAVLFSKEGFHEEFYQRASYDSQLNFVDDESTMEWWQSQPDEVFMEAFGGEMSLLDMLTEFNGFIDRHKPVTIWCKGASFDFPIVNSALNFHQLKELPYQKLRCMRGLNNLLDVPLLKFKGTAHNALDDAKNQAMNVGRAISAVKGWSRL